MAEKPENNRVTGLQFHIYYKNERVVNSWYGKLECKVFYPKVLIILANK